MVKAEKLPLTICGHRFQFFNPNFLFYIGFAKTTLPDQICGTPTLATMKDSHFLTNLRILFEMVIWTQTELLNHVKFLYLLLFFYGIIFVIFSHSFVGVSNLVSTNDFAIILIIQLQTYTYSINLPSVSFILQEKTLLGYTYLNLL